MRSSFLLMTRVAVLSLFLLAPNVAQAQAQAQQQRSAQVAQAAPGTTTSALPERIQRPMRAVDPVTLRAEGLSIRLWGIRPATSGDTPLELRAMELMDTLIQEGQVNCKLEGGVIPELIGRCVVQSNQDLALELLGNGYAIVDRRQTYNTVFATNYEKAQEQARAMKKGVWALIDRQAVTLPKWLQSDILAPLVIFGGMLLGFGFNALLMLRFMGRVSQSQTSENRQSERKEALLQSRERQVLVTTLEGELTENKNKIEAFLVIYGDLLKSLSDPMQPPKYQQVGDIVQKHPSFSKTVFEANVAKLSLLDIKLAGHLSKLYSAMPKEQEYINLDQNVPLDTAVKLVEKVLQDSQDLLDPINQVIRELQEAAKQ
ncbi:MAG: thermonuclease family protein [Alphaproteobacteria bacterium]